VGHPWSSVYARIALSASIIRASPGLGCSCTRTRFTMILSDLVATVAQGSCPDVDFYDSMVSRGIISAVPEPPVPTE
jgi:hypothetical protein